MPFVQCPPSMSWKKSTNKKLSCRRSFKDRKPPGFFLQFSGPWLQFQMLITHTFHLLSNMASKRTASQISGYQSPKSPRCMMNFPSLLWMLYLWSSRALLKRLTVFDPWSLELFPNSNWSYTSCTRYTQQNNGTGVMMIGPCLESHLSKGPFTTSSTLKSCSFPKSTNLWRKNPDSIKFQSPQKIPAKCI